MSERPYRPYLIDSHQQVITPDQGYPRMNAEVLLAEAERRGWTRCDARCQMWPPRQIHPSEQRTVETPAGPPRRVLAADILHGPVVGRLPDGLAPVMRSAGLDRPVGWPDSRTGPAHVAAGRGSGADSAPHHPLSHDTRDRLRTMIGRYRYQPRPADPGWSPSSRPTVLTPALGLLFRAFADRLARHPECCDGSASPDSARHT